MISPSRRNSDRALAPAIRWLLDHHRDGIALALQDEFLAGFSGFGKPLHRYGKTMQSLTSNAVDWLLFDAQIEHPGETMTGAGLLLQARPSTFPEDLLGKLDADRGYPLTFFEMFEDDTGTARWPRLELVDIMSPDQVRHPIRKADLEPRISRLGGLWGGRLRPGKTKGFWQPTAADFSIDHHSYHATKRVIETELELFGKGPERRFQIALCVIELWSHSVAAHVGEHELLLDELLARLEAEASGEKVPAPESTSRARQPKARSKKPPRPGGARGAAEPIPEIHEAVCWLLERHGPTALDAIEDDFLVGLDEDELETVQQHMPRRLDAQMTLNIFEWLIAESMLEVEGTYVPAAQLLLAPSGPLRDDRLRGWIEAHRDHPIRPYAVTRILGPYFAKLRDLTDLNFHDRLVHFSQDEALTEGMIIGLRLLPSGDMWQPSSAMYPLPTESEALHELYTRMAIEVRGSVLADDIVSMTVRQLTGELFADISKVAPAEIEWPELPWFEEFRARFSLPLPGFLFPPGESEAILRLCHQNAPANEVVERLRGAYLAAQKVWLDRPLPILRGKTPRAARRSERPVDRERLILALVGAEMHEEALAEMDDRQRFSLRPLWQLVDLDRKTELRRFLDQAEEPQPELIKLVEEAER